MDEHNPTPGVSAPVSATNPGRAAASKSPLWRRLLPVLAAPTVIAVSGVLAYTQFWSIDDELNASSPVARTAPLASEELKSLFAEDTPEPTAESVEPEDRYADGEAAAEPDPLANLFADAGTEESAEDVSDEVMVGDRYAMPAQPATAEDDSFSQPETDSPTPAEPEVTRGQDSEGFNPLRAAATATIDQEAVAAFSEAKPIPPLTEPKPRTTPLATPQPAPLTKALPAASEKPAAALPLGSAPPPTGRYAPGPATLRPEPSAASRLASVEPLSSPTLPPTSATPQVIAGQSPASQTASAQPGLATGDGVVVNPFAGAALGSPAAARAAAAPVNNYPAAGVPSPLATRSPKPLESALPRRSPLTDEQALGAESVATDTPPSRPLGTGQPGDVQLEGAQSPSLGLQKVAPAEMQVGEECAVALRVQNTGGRSAQAVTIVDEVPQGTRLISTTPRAMVHGSQVTWNLGTLAVGEERTVQMRLMPEQEGELGSVATVSFAAQASAKSRCTKPELALRLTCPSTVHVGEQHLIKIEVSNPGSGDAKNVILLETIPEGVTHEAGPSLEFEVGTLAAGEARELELIVTGEQAGRVLNQMTAQADAGLRIDAACEFEIVAPALEVAVEGPQRRFLERPASYQVSIQNPGTAPARDVRLVTHLPQGLEFVSANNMGEYDSSTHTVHWSLAELPASERGTVELVALPVEPGAHTLEVHTQAALGLEDRAEKRVTVEGIAALSFEVTDVSSPIETGGETTYEIRVSNQGTKEAANVQVAAMLPAGLRAVSASGETRQQITGQQVVFAPIGRLAPKGETQYRVVAQGTRPGDHRVRVQITSDEVQQPIVKEVSTRVYADE